MSGEQANKIHGWCRDCDGSGMFMDLGGPTDCPNLDLHRAIEECVDERRASA